MASDVRIFVQECAICAQNKPSHSPSAGLLQPLPVPPRPWHTISMDFVTDLPPSEGFTTSLVAVVGRWVSMWCHAT